MGLRPPACLALYTSVMKHICKQHGSMVNVNAHAESDACCRVAKMRVERTSLNPRIFIFILAFKARALLSLKFCNAGSNRKGSRELRPPSMQVGRL